MTTTGKGPPETHACMLAHRMSCLTSINPMRKPMTTGQRERRPQNRVCNRTGLLRQEGQECTGATRPVFPPQPRLGCSKATKNVRGIRSQASNAVVRANDNAQTLRVASHTKTWHRVCAQFPRFMPLYPIINETVVAAIPCSHRPVLLQSSFIAVLPLPPPFPKRTPGSWAQTAP